MRGVNKVILVGNVGRDPEVRSFAGGGGTLTTVSLATSEQWKDKNTGQMTEQTEWHRVVFYGRLAENAAAYVRKGGKIYVEGSLQTRKWQDKEGHDRYSTEIKAQSMLLLDGRSGSGGGGGQPSAPEGDYGNGQDDYQQSSRPARPAAPANNKPAAPSANSDFDDDLPF